MDYYRANGDLGRKNVVKKRGASDMTLTIDQGKITPYAHAPLLRHSARRVFFLQVFKKSIFLAVHNSSIGHLVPWSVGRSV